MQLLLPQTRTRHWAAILTTSPTTCHCDVCARTAKPGTAPETGCRTPAQHSGEMPSTAAHPLRPAALAGCIPRLDFSPPAPQSRSVSGCCSLHRCYCSYCQRRCCCCCCCCGEAVTASRRLAGARSMCTGMAGCSLDSMACRQGCGASCGHKKIVLPFRQAGSAPGIAEAVGIHCASPIDNHDIPEADHGLPALPTWHADAIKTLHIHREQAASVAMCLAWQMRKSGRQQIQAHCTLACPVRRQGTPAKPCTHMIRRGCPAVPTHQFAL